METSYVDFINDAVECGLTETQANFLWNWINKIAREKAQSGGFI